MEKIAECFKDLILSLSSGTVMKELVFVGLGLNDEYGITLKGLEETRTADAVFMETYTSRMPDFNMQHFEELCGKKIQIIKRQTLEDENGKLILEAAQKGKAVFLVPGDPFIATTHVTLRIDAEKMGIKTRIVHGISIMSQCGGYTDVCHKCISTHDSPVNVKCYV